MKVLKQFVTGKFAKSLKRLCLKITVINSDQTNKTNLELQSGDLSIISETL